MSENVVIAALLFINRCVTSYRSQFTVGFISGMPYTSSNGGWFLASILG